MLTHIWHNFKQIDYKYHVACGLLMRALVIQYGQYHDETYTVPFTDIDYKVFTDAARHVLNNTSPYDRHTYRYSPLVAVLLTPNVLLHNCFGKVLFSFVDITVALLIRVIVRHSLKEFEVYKQRHDYKNHKNETKLKLTHLGDEKQAASKRNRRKKHKTETKKSEIDVTADLSMLIWLYNPLTIAIATRGNCDSIAGLLVLTTLYFLECKRKPFWAGVFHGVAVHVRLYPIAYSLALFMYLSKFSFYSPDYRRQKDEDLSNTIENKIGNEGKRNKHGKNARNTKQNAVKIVKRDTCDDKVALVNGKKERRTIFKKEYLLYLLPNFDQLKLISGCLLSLVFLTGLFYLLYGYKFLYESYIYHLVRKDTRHNFSLYFYLQYLTAGIKNVGLWQRLLTVLPQLSLVLVLSIRYGLNKLTLNFAVLSETIVMVSYNTVLTSQYFVWILSILPLCVWQVRLSKKMASFLVLIWFLSQAAWLLPAYFLEFHGHNMFLYIWVQSVAFFSANMAILGRLIRNFMVVKLDKVV